MLNPISNQPHSNPAYESQAAFRALMDCTARPGEIRTLDGIEAPTPFAPATAALIKSLADYETPVWLDSGFASASKVAEWIRFHVGAPLTANAADAAFALVANVAHMTDLSRFAQGSSEYPDRSTTILVQVDDFAGTALNLRGPGIKTEKSLAASPLPADFVTRMAENRALFPRGVDLVLVAGTRIAALPRSVIVGER